MDPAVGNDPNQNPTDPLPPAQPEVTSITLKSNGYPLTANDITLPLGDSAQLEAVVTPSDWRGQVTWTSSNPEWVTVNDTGLVTNVNSSGSFHNAYLTITAGNMSIQCVVRVRAVPSSSGATPPPASNPPADPTAAVTQEPAPGGTVTTGRRVRIIFV